MRSEHQRVLTEKEIETFQRDGILVLDNFLTDIELLEAKDGLEETLLHYGVDTANLRETAHNLKKLSSTNGSGGVLDIFYPGFKLKIGSSEKLFRATTELWEAAYCHDGETEEELTNQKSQYGTNHYKYHPFGKFDCSKGYMYIDRLGYRLPTNLAEEIGEREMSKKMQEKESANSTESDRTEAMKALPTKKKKKNRKMLAIQRSLTPHLDCCPDDYYSKDGKSKWRPIQCFVSLTDNLEPNTGGFEAATGFHHQFHHWAKERIKSPSIITKRDAKSGAKIKVKIPAPCLGDYSHIRPNEDADVIKAVQHLPVRAGSVVLWDNRIPHSNAYRNDGLFPRAVVYCSFLPDVPINRKYVEQQLEDYNSRKCPRDQWINGEGKEENFEIFNFSDIGRKLIGIDPW